MYEVPIKCRDEAPKPIAGTARRKSATKSRSAAGPGGTRGSWCRSGWRPGTELLSRIGAGVAFRPESAQSRLDKRVRGIDHTDERGTRGLEARTGRESVKMRERNCQKAAAIRQKLTGVAYRPEQCAALRLKTCEARPDALAGPARGKVDEATHRRRSRRTTGAWCRRGWRPSSGTTEMPRRPQRQKK